MLPITPFFATSYLQIGYLWFYSLNLEIWILTCIIPLAIWFKSLEPRLIRKHNYLLPISTNSTLNFDFAQYVVDRAREYPKTWFYI